MEDSGVATYQYDTIGRLITMTIPAGITSVGACDKANRVIGLTHTDANGFLLGEYDYTLNSVGKPQLVTETLPLWHGLLRRCGRSPDRVTISLIRVG